MKILFISIWPADSGIFESTIPPTIKYWLENNLVEQVDVITFDPKPTTLNLSSAKLNHFSIQANNFSNHFFKLIAQVKSSIGIAKAKSYDLIWARGVTSGNIAFLTSVFSNIPFAVESFEPHTDYMIEGRVWTSNSVKAIIQRILENRMGKKAKILITVSELYATTIASKYQRSINSIFSMACAIDYKQFRYNKAKGLEIRKSHNIKPEDHVGIYVGKFGDIYYDDEFFNLISNLIQKNHRIKTLILTPMLNHAIRQRARFNIPVENMIIKSVAHHEVPGYLSASDFGYCPVKESESRRFCSPIKVGEYLANGLPIVISRGIGDDSELIEKNNWGLVLDFEKVSMDSINSILSLSRNSIYNQDIKPFRDQEILYEKYKAIF
jgi:glycosyltransferase involved in cell wall biosynthesis